MVGFGGLRTLLALLYCNVCGVCGLCYYVGLPLGFWFWAVIAA